MAILQEFSKFFHQYHTLIPGYDTLVRFLQTIPENQGMPNYFLLEKSGYMPQEEQNVLNLRSIFKQ